MFSLVVTLPVTPQSVGASGSDDLTFSTMSTDQHIPLRDKPLTPGDDPVVDLSGNIDTCLSHAPQGPLAVTDLQGNSSDILISGQ